MLNGLIDYLTVAIIISAAMYFITLGCAAISKPNIAARFLLGFAENPKVHYLELFLRLIVGFALMHHSDKMQFANISSFFAWVLIISTICLLVLPWRWHYRFAKKTVPYANRYLGIIGISSLGIGIFLIYSMNFI